MKIRQVAAHLPFKFIAESRHPGLAEDVRLFEHDQAIVPQFVCETVDPMAQLRDRQRSRVVKGEKCIEFVDQPVATRKDLGLGPRIPCDR